jgi:hypothetical protein
MESLRFGTELMNDGEHAFSTGWCKGCEVILGVLEFFNAVYPGTIFLG